MSKYLSPKGIQEEYQISRSTSYQLIKKFIKDGGEVVRIGKLTRVNAEQLEKYLKGTRNDENTTKSICDLSVFE